jgi:hypothetical protein
MAAMNHRIVMLFGGTASFATYGLTSFPFGLHQGIRNEAGSLIETLE